MSTRLKRNSRKSNDIAEALTEYQGDFKDAFKEQDLNFFDGGGIESLFEGTDKSRRSKDFLRGPREALDSAFDLDDAAGDALEGRLAALGASVAQKLGKIGEDARLFGATFSANLVEKSVASGGGIDQLDGVITELSEKFGANGAFGAALVDFQDTIDGLGDGSFDQLKGELSDITGIDFSKTAQDLQGLFAESNLEAEDFGKAVEAALKKLDPALAEKFAAAVESGMEDAALAVLATSDALKAVEDFSKDAAEGLLDVPLAMNQALDDEGHTGPHVDKLKKVFERVATILVNDVPDWEDDLGKTPART